jgi:hypothetical protein
MSTPARKVSLIDVKDYPRSKYSAHWHIVVSGGPEDGYRWSAEISKWGEPAYYEWRGKKLQAWPSDVPHPVYPAPVPTTQEAYLAMAPAEQAHVRSLQDAWRAACAAVYEAHPKPRYTLEETVGAVIASDLPTAKRSAIDGEVGVQGRTDGMTKEEIARGQGKVDAVARLEALDQALRDAADTAAQSWVLSKMPGYEIKEVPKLQGGHAMALGPAGMVWDVMAELARWLARPFLMALRYSTTIRDNRLTQVVTAIDGGAGAGLLRIYDGSQPATCGTATTLLAEITLSDPCGVVSAQVLTFDNTPALTDASANNAGTATWHRFVDSTATCCVDGTVGTAASDINFNSVIWSALQSITVTSYTITAGNP